MIYGLSLIVVLGIVWIINITSQQQDRIQVLNKLYTVLGNSSLENDESSAQEAYEQIKSLLTEDSTN